MNKDIYTFRCQEDYSGVDRQATISFNDTPDMTTRMKQIVSALKVQLGDWHWEFLIKYLFEGDEDGALEREMHKWIKVIKEEARDDVRNERQNSSHRCPVCGSDNQVVNGDVVGCVPRQLSNPTYAETQQVKDAQESHLEEPDFDEPY